MDKNPLIVVALDDDAETQVSDSREIFVDLRVQFATTTLDRVTDDISS
jgi:hypothetical protein